MADGHANWVDLFQKGKLARRDSKRRRGYRRVAALRYNCPFGERGCRGKVNCSCNPQF
jgi:hypothetical protein